MLNYLVTDLISLIVQDALIISYRFLVIFEHMCILRGLIKHEISV